MTRQMTQSMDEVEEIVDRSNIDLSKLTNPYNALIDACQDDPVQIQLLYSKHRLARNAQQKDKLLASNFAGLHVDPILVRLVDPSIEPGFVDPRHSLNLSARPPQCIRDLIAKIQQRLMVSAPNIWLMPAANLHLTVMEIAHSEPASAVAETLSKFAPAAISHIVNYTFTHSTRLIKPMMSYDDTAIALSFLPEAGPGVFLSPRAPLNVPDTQQSYTYHHLRRDLYALCSSAGVVPSSRYVVPSIHITCGRFLTQRDHKPKRKMQIWVDHLEEINAWLQRDYWPKADEGKQGIEWEVGKEHGLICRKGTLWYGGGESVAEGRGS